MITDLLLKEAFLLVIAAIMIAVGILKDNKVLHPAYYYIQKHIKNKKLMLCVMSTVYGILPIPGRITVATGMFDTCTRGSKDRTELGILAYLSTHHYYLWSPLEKSVLLVLAGTGMSYMDFIGAMGIYIGIFLGATYYYVVFVMKDVTALIKDFATQPVKGDWCKFIDMIVLISGIILCCIQTFNVLYFFPSFAVYIMIRYPPRFRKVWEYVDIKLLAAIAVVIGISFTIQQHTEDIRIIAERLATLYGIHIGLVVSFFAAFLLGSSSRFAAITVIMTSIFGIAYMPLFYIVDYCGYLLSPTHKCVAVGNMYFKTKFIAFYKIVGIISLILITASIVRHFII
tara:strand:+ start:1956 stop:2981 length:1026 start_codon:yes stop_codon:yes gene_type:complete